MSTGAKDVFILKSDHFFFPTFFTLDKYNSLPCFFKNGRHRTTWNMKSCMHFPVVFMRKLNTLNFVVLCLFFFVFFCNAPPWLVCYIDLDSGANTGWGFSAQLCLHVFIFLNQNKWFMWKNENCPLIKFSIKVKVALFGRNTGNTNGRKTVTTLVLQKIMCNLFKYFCF